MLDATGLAPVETVVRVATGRDAADVAWATTLSGDLALEDVAVAVRAAGRSRPRTRRPGGQMLGSPPLAMATFLYRMGRWIAAHRLPVLIAWLVIAIGLVVLVGQVGADTSNNLTLPGTGSQKATDLLAAHFPPQQNGSNPLVFHATSGKVTDAENKQAILDSRKAMLALPYVVSATSPFSQQGAGQVSKDKTTAYIPVLLSIGAADLEDSQAEAVLRRGRPGQAGRHAGGGRGHRRHPALRRPRPRAARSSASSPR